MAITRRTLMACGCVSALSQATAWAASTGRSTTLSSTQALQMLKEGNKRFRSGTLPPSDIAQGKRMELASGQSPYAVVLCCSDSRVPPELLFAAGLGDLFVVRNAGNTADAAAMGTIEYGVAVLEAPLLVVLGHEKCGAVQAAVDVVKANREFSGSIGEMIEPIVPAVLKARAKDGDLLDNAVKENVARTVRRLSRESEPLLGRPFKEGKLKIVGARYDLQDGAVEFFE